MPKSLVTLEKDEGIMISLARKLEEHPVTRLLAMLGIIIAIAAFAIDYSDRKEERMARAWQLLTAKNTGNSGKVVAIEFLFSNGVKLNGLDLSCDAMGGAVDNVCQRGVYLRDLNIVSKGSELEQVFYISSLSGADLTSAKFEGIQSIKTIFSGSKMQSSEFSRSYFFSPSFNAVNMQSSEFINVTIEYGNFQNCDCMDIDFIDSKLISPNFQYTQLFNSRFKAAVKITNPNFAEAYLDYVSFDDTTIVFHEGSKSFDGTSLTHTSFEGTTLEGYVDFTGAYALDGGIPKGLAKRFLGQVILCGPKDLPLNSLGSVEVCQSLREGSKLKMPIITN